MNKYNNSLVSLDNFNTHIYKNANMAILGTSGAGKTFTMQLIARRMRLAGTPVYIIAPLKGHEFYRQAKALNGTIIRIVPGSPIASTSWRFAKSTTPAANCWTVLCRSSRNWLPKSRSCTFSSRC
ncbi:hypothetical protein NIA69_18925 [Gemmiger formicilis]|nr:hypothetical protein [Gemmiger formicilis]